MDLINTTDQPGPCDTLTVKDRQQNMSALLVILFVSLFIPTNNPGFIEAVLALPLGILLLTLSRQSTKAKGPEQQIAILWLLTLFTITAETMFSRSTGASLTTLVRYAEGFVVFYIAASFRAGHKPLSRLFSTFGLLTCLLFVLLIAIYGTKNTIPYYNSFVGINGHHPAAYTIIATLPFIVLIGTQGSMLLRYLVLGASLLLSAGRLTWGMAAIFFAAQTTRAIKMTRNIPAVITLILLLGAIAITMWTAHIPSPQKTSLVSSAALLRWYTKDTNTPLRLEFAGQAITAIRKSPFTGHGPGTFSLLSRQYQSEPGVFSRHAHSFPLETLAENGIFGSISVALLFIVIFFRAVRALAKNDMAPFGWAIILTVLYSLFEVNLNSLPHWLIFWATAGALYTRPQQHSHYNLRGIAVLTGILLSAFSLTFLAARSYATRQNTGMAITLAPYDKSIVTLHASNSPHLTAEQIHSIQIWHRDDPDILMALSRFNPIYLPRALARDPHNTQYLNTYFTRLLNHGDLPALLTLLCRSADGSIDQSCPLAASRPFAVFIKDKTHAIEPLRHLTGDDGYAKFLYFLGVSLYAFTGDTLSTTYLWQKAQEAAPQWGFYYLEVAGAQYHWLNDITAAEKTIALCMNHPSAANGCRLVTDIRSLLRPGLYSRDIIIIPAIQ